MPNVSTVPLTATVARPPLDLVPPHPACERAWQKKGPLDAQAFHGSSYFHMQPDRQIAEASARFHHRLELLHSLWAWLCVAAIVLLSNTDKMGGFPLLIHKLEGHDNYFA